MIKFWWKAKRTSCYPCVPTVLQKSDFSPGFLSYWFCIVDVFQKNRNWTSPVSIAESLVFKLAAKSGKFRQRRESSVDSFGTRCNSVVGKVRGRVLQWNDVVGRVLLSNAIGRAPQWNVTGWVLERRRSLKRDINCTWTGCCLFGGSTSCFVCGFFSCCCTTEYVHKMKWNL